MVLSKVVRYSITSVGHWAECVGSQPTCDISHKPGARLPLFFTRPAVTYPAKEITPLAGSKLYCLV